MFRFRITPTSTVVPILAVMILSMLCATTEFAAQPSGDHPAVVAAQAVPNAGSNAETTSSSEAPSVDVPAVDAVAPSNGTSDSAVGETDSDDAQLDYCPATPAVGIGAQQAANPKRHGYCRCSCGYPCRTSADCGGVSCDPFITCC